MFVLKLSGIQTILNLKQKMEKKRIYKYSKRVLRKLMNRIKILLKLINRVTIL